MTILDDRLLVDLIDRIYDAAADAARWSEVVVALGAAFDAQFSLAFGMERLSSRMLYGQSWGLSADVLALHETFAALDAGMPAAVRATKGSFVADQAIPKRMPRQTNAIFDEFPRPIDKHRLVAVLPGNSLGTKVTVGLTKARDLRPFDACEQAFFERLVPHIQRAVFISGKLVNGASAEILSQKLMTRAHFGVITIRSGGYIVDSNPRGASLLHVGDGLYRAHGRMLARNRTVNDELQTALSNVERYAIGHLDLTVKSVLVSRLDAPPLHLVVAPLTAIRPAANIDVPIIAVFVFPQGARPAIEASTLSRLYGFTPAEARVAARLAEGYDLAEIAKSSLVSIETVRTHVKRSLAKTHCDSQSALVREILLGPALSVTET